MQRQELRLTFWTLIGTFIFLFVDMIGDYQEGADWIHFSIELMSLVFISSGIYFLFRELKRRNEEHKLTQQVLRVTSSQLTEKSIEASNWRAQHAKLSEGLGFAIDGQLDQWKLSPAEKDIARLLLKGFSFKEISTLRGTSEKTIRQQAQNIYLKAGLPGRAELAAFFLEDLLSPIAETSGPLDHFEARAETTVSK